MATVTEATDYSRFNSFLWDSFPPDRAPSRCRQRHFARLLGQEEEDECRRELALKVVEFLHYLRGTPLRRIHPELRRLAGL